MKYMEIKKHDVNVQMHIFFSISKSLFSTAYEYYNNKQSFQNGQKTLPSTLLFVSHTTTYDNQLLFSAQTVVQH